MYAYVCLYVGTQRGWGSSEQRGSLVSVYALAAGQLITYGAYLSSSLSAGPGNDCS